MKVHFLIILVMLNFILAIAQEHAINDARLINQFSSKATLPGGDIALESFIPRHAFYPRTEVNKDFRGTVRVGFLIDENGKVKNPVILKSVSTVFDKEALRIVNMLPEFKPAVYENKPMRDYYVVDFIFKMEVH